MDELAWSWVLALALALLSALCVWLYLRHTRRRRPQLQPLPPPEVEPPPLRVRSVRLHGRTRHPIVLAHGWGCIEGMLPSQLGFSSFREIPAALRACGHEVYVARVAPAASIELRAQQLARQVYALDQRVNIIAHSMGGLDARLAVARHGIGDRVASLITIGTPHHGTPLADAALELADFRRARAMLRRFGLDLDGVYDLSTARMREFNAAVPDTPDVYYAHVLAGVERDAVHKMLAAGHRYILRSAGPNDGVVPVLSQRWGEIIEEVDADHWAQIGWFGRFDVRTFYTRLARRLIERDL